MWISFFSLRTFLSRSGATQKFYLRQKRKNSPFFQLDILLVRNGAAEGTRTLDNQLGKLELYQLSYGRYQFERNSVEAF